MIMSRREERLCCVLANAFLDVPCEDVLPYLARRLCEMNAVDTERLEPIFFELVAPVVSFNLIIESSASEHIGFQDESIIEEVRRIHYRRCNSRIYYSYNKCMALWYRLRFAGLWREVVESINDNRSNSTTEPEMT